MSESSLLKSFDDDSVPFGYEQLEDEWSETEGDLMEAQREELDRKRRIAAKIVGEHQTIISKGVIFYKDHNDLLAVVANMGYDWTTLSERQIDHIAERFKEFMDAVWRSTMMASAWEVIDGGKKRSDAMESGRDGFGESE